MLHKQAITAWCALILLSCSSWQSRAQFLATTCPSTAPAKCPGMCAASKQERSRGYCTGDQCRRILAKPADKTLSSSSAAARTSKPLDPPPNATITNHPTAAEQVLPWWQQQQAAAALAGTVVPQRVLPLQYVDQPEETAEQQQAIIKHLQDTYSGKCSADDMVAAGSSAAAGTNSSCTEAAAVSTPDSKSLPTAAAVYLPGAYAGPTTQVTRKLTFLSNSKIKIGLDIERAGAISWLSSSMIPVPWKDKNLVNIWDQGRLLQQSFYGCVDGSCWATSPWLWNPVQGGSWENQPGLTVQKVVQSNRLYVEGHGRNWGKQDLIKELLMTSDVTLQDNYATVKFSVKYTGTVTHPYMTQEVPAVFIDRRFSVLAYYDAAKPWANDNAITYAFPPGRNMYARPTEFWAAYIDPVTGWGVGVFNPMAWMGITAYRIGSDGSDRPWDCSYFAHTIRMQLHPNMKPYNYTAYITVGKLDTIRATFYKLKATPGTAGRCLLYPGVMPISKSASHDPSQVEVPGLTAGQPSLGRNPVFGTPANYSLFSNVLVEVTDPSASSDPVAAAAGNSSMPGGKAASGADSQAGSPPGISAGSKPIGPMDRQVSSDVHSAAGRGSTRSAVAGVVAAVVGCALLAGTALAGVKRRRQANMLQQGATAAAAAAAGHRFDIDNTGSRAYHATEQQTPQNRQRQSDGAEAVHLHGAIATFTPSTTTPGMLTRSHAALASAQV